MPDDTSRNTTSNAEIVAALATVVLTILGLAHVVSEYLVAIATIVFGATLLLHGSAVIAEYARANTRAATTAPSVVQTGDGGLSVVLLAGAAGIVLGILAILGISTHELTAIAVIAFGAALILGASLTLRVHLLRLSSAIADERTQRLGSEALASDLLSSTAGIFGLTGLAAIVLGILALAGFAPVVLVLIALLVLGSVTALVQIDLSSVLVNAYSRS